MTDSRLFLGIDFGTSNSSIAYIYNDPRHYDSKIIHPEVVQIAVDDEGITRTGRMPTVVSTQFDDRRSKKILFGWEFFRQFGKKKKNASLLRRGRDFFESVKSDLGSYKIYPRAFSSEYNTPEKVAQQIIAHLLKQASLKLPFSDIQKSHVVVTVPASLSAEARKQTKEAAQRAGLQEERIELIDEPIAALLDLVNDPRVCSILELDKLKKLLVFDYGGGTLDLCLVRAVYDRDSKSGLLAENLAISQYRRNGGNDVDRAVMEQVIWPQIEKQVGKSRSDLPLELRCKLEDTFTPTVARRLKEQVCNRIAKALEDGTNWTAVKKKGIKETDLLGRSFRDDNLPECLHERFQMTMDEFDELMGPFLTVPSADRETWDEGFAQSLVLPIWETVAKANLSPEEVDALILHGGSCRNPYVRTVLRDVLTAEDSLFSHMQIIETPDLDTSVARGAALACYWKHARDVEIIPPIIAEELGIMTLSDKPVCLVESGHKLPFPNENELKDAEEPFYIPQSGQRNLLVPFYAGTNESCRVSGTVCVELPANVKRGDVVRIKFQVDRDKVVHWWYSLNNGDFVRAKPMQDPWIKKELLPSYRRLFEYRRKMREEFIAVRNIPKTMLLNEASMLYRADELDEAELVVLDYIGEYGWDSHSANLMALIYDDRGDRAIAEQYAKKAITLEPQNPFFLANYGWLLGDMGRTDEAIARLRAAIGIYPQNPALYYAYERLGDIFREKGDEQGAQREYGQAILYAQTLTSQQPEAALPWQALARLYNKIGEYEQAAEASKRSVSADLDEFYGGDHRHVIAGLDSGF